MINSKRLIDTFCELVKIPSESPNDKEFIQYIETLLKKESYKTHIDNFGNLIIKVDAKDSNKKESILFCCHADTVKPGVGIEPVIENGIIKSKGNTILGADNKAGIAELIEMLRCLKKNPPLEILITRCEEIGTLGIRSVDYNYIKSKNAYVLDGDKIENIVIGGPTYISFDVTYTGISAHAGMEPEKGLSAIKAAAYAISKMKLGRLDFESTANVGKIEGGIIRNGIPENLTLLAECRSLNHKKCLKNAEKMKKLFEKGAKKVGVKVDIKEEIGIKAYSLKGDEPVICDIEKSFKKFNIKTKKIKITGGTDASILNEKGVSSIILGAAYRKEHTKDEFVIIDEMETITKVIIDFVENKA